MQGAFISALTYNPPEILGRPLYHFSSFHGLILEAAGSPFVCEGKPDFDDLIFGAWVCSHKFSDGFKGVGDIPAAHKWGRKLKKCNLQAAMSGFTDYINAAFNQPEYWKSGDSESIRASYWWHLVFFGMSKLHLAESDAWDYSVAKLTCLQAVWAETEGNKNLMSAEDIKGLETLRQDEIKTKEIK